MQPILTAGALHELLNTYAKEPLTLEDVLWFVCMQKAAFISEACTLKDIAGMVLDGIAPYKKEPELSIVSYLNEQYEEAVDEYGEVYEGAQSYCDEITESIITAIKEHVGYTDE